MKSTRLKIYIAVFIVAVVFYIEVCFRASQSSSEVVREKDLVLEEIAGGLEIVDYKGAATDIIIPDRIDGQDIVSIADRSGIGAFEDRGITQLVLPARIVHIGARAFAFNKLATLSLPQSVREIGDAAFYRNNLESLSLPQGLTHMGEYAFATNKITGHIALPQSLVTVSRYAFANNAITSLTLGPNVTSLEEAAFADNISDSQPRSFTTVKITTPSPPAVVSDGPAPSFDDTIVATLFVPTPSLHLYQSDKHWASLFPVISTIITP